MVYGPSRPDPGINFQQHRTHTYLRGKANKIRYDMAKWFRMYNGKLVRIYTKDRSSGRCTTCTDTITGAIVLENCPECRGTGWTAGYIFVEECWSLAEIEASMLLTSELGNTENTRAGKDSFMFTSEHLLTDQELVVFVDTKEVYKVVDVEPKMVAMGGIVVVQAANLSYLTPGSKEYSVVDW